MDQIVKDPKRANLNITDEGDISDFLGVNISFKDDKTINLTQPHLIDQIVKDLKMNDKTKSNDILACSSRILKRNLKGVPFDNTFHYRSVIGKLKYLEKATRSDTSYIMHQCARFVEEPCENHTKAI
jgi:hypothetical protein